MQQLQKVFGDSWTEVSTAMGAFGAPTLKPTKLISSSPSVGKLARAPTVEQRETIKANSEVTAVVNPVTGSVSGGCDLKAAQAYPAGYGEAVAIWFDDERGETDPISESDSDEENAGVHMEATDMWLDTGLRTVCAQLKVTHDRAIF